MTYLLHLDTSGNEGCVAISCNGTLVCHTVNNEARNHAGSINVMIDAMLKEAGITFKELSAVVVCAGPGSYTGLRISMATAKGLCYAIDIPLLLDNKLTLLAYQAFRKQEGKFNYYIPVLLAREKEYFMSIFDNVFENIVPATHLLGADMEEMLKDKNGICFISNEMDDENHQKYTKNAYVDSETTVDLSYWSFYSFEEYKCNKTVNLSTAEPFYLKQVYTHK